MGVTDESAQLVERVAALDIGKAGLVAHPLRGRRVGGGAAASGVAAGVPDQCDDAGATHEALVVRETLRRHHTSDPRRRLIGPEPRAAGQVIRSATAKASASICAGPRRSWLHALSPAGAHRAYRCRGAARLIAARVIATRLSVAREGRAAATGMAAARIRQATHLVVSRVRAVIHRYQVWVAT